VWSSGEAEEISGGECPVDGGLHWSPSRESERGVVGKRKSRGEAGHKPYSESLAVAPFLMKH
jgi:hypothetical protein